MALTGLLVLFQGGHCHELQQSDLENKTPVYQHLKPSFPRGSFLSFNYDESHSNLTCQHPEYSGLNFSPLHLLGKPWFLYQFLGWSNYAQYQTPAPGSQPPPEKKQLRPWLSSFLWADLL